MVSLSLSFLRHMLQRKLLVSRPEFPTAKPFPREAAGDSLEPLQRTTALAWVLPWGCPEHTEVPRALASGWVHWVA